MLAKRIRSLQHLDEDGAYALARRANGVEINRVRVEDRALSDDVALVADHVHELVAIEEPGQGPVLLTPLSPSFDRDRHVLGVGKAERHEGVRRPAPGVVERREHEPRVREAIEVVRAIVVARREVRRVGKSEVADAGHVDEMPVEARRRERRLERNPVAIAARLHRGHPHGDRPASGHEQGGGEEQHAPAGCLHASPSRIDKKMRNPDMEILV